MSLYTDPFPWDYDHADTIQPASVNPVVTTTADGEAAR